MTDDLRLWHPAGVLPTPGIPLRLLLTTGDVVDGSRPNYIERRDLDDLGYRDLGENRLQNVMKWAIR